MQELLERNPLLKQFMLPIVLGVLGLICLGYGLIVLSKPQDNSRDILFEAASDASPFANQAESREGVTVDVAGAVVKPGVYTLKGDSRMQDALIAAGGMSAEADRDSIAKGLNLAAKVVDGAKIYIPKKGEELAAEGMQTVMGSADGLVNINGASQSQLESLPGIGQVTAEKIIGNRPYVSIEELVQKKILGQKVFDQIKDKIAAF